MSAIKRKLVPCEIIINRNYLKWDDFTIEKKKKNRKIEKQKNRKTEEKKVILKREKKGQSRRFIR